MSTPIPTQIALPKVMQLINDRAGPQTSLSQRKKWKESCWTPLPGNVLGKYLDPSLRRLHWEEKCVRQEERGLSTNIYHNVDFIFFLSPLLKVMSCFFV